MDSILANRTMLVLLTLALSTECQTKREYLENVAPYSYEFYRHSTIERALHPHQDSGERHRRGTADDNAPVGSFIIDSSLPVEFQHATGMVYRFFLMLYTSPPAEQIENITIVGGTSLGGSSIVVGSAHYADMSITMYMDHIPSVDVYMVVLIHEVSPCPVPGCELGCIPRLTGRLQVLHLMGFGVLSGTGKRSFTNRSDPFTLEFDSPPILACVKKYMGAASDATLHSDAVRAHWNTSMGFMENDVMLPYIHFDKTATSRCTVETVLESRSWTSHLCVDDDDCHDDTRCLTMGQHWISVCQIPPEDPPGRPYRPVHVLVQFAVFSIVVSVFWIGVVACVRRPMDIYRWNAAFATIPSTET